MAKKKVTKKEPVITPEVIQEPPRRADFEHNAGLIRDAFFLILQNKKGRMPTLQELADNTGLSLSAVRNHMDEFNKKEHTDLNAAKYRLLTPDVIMSIAKAAMKGSAGSQKLWMQIVEGWSEKQELSHSGEIKATNQPPTVLVIGK